MVVCGSSQKQPAASNKMGNMKRAIPYPSDLSPDPNMAALRKGAEIIERSVFCLEEFQSTEAVSIIPPDANPLAKRIRCHLSCNAESNGGVAQRLEQRLHKASRSETPRKIR